MKSWSRDTNLSFKVGHTSNMHENTHKAVFYNMYGGFLDGKWEDHLIPNRERRTPGSHDFNFFIVPKGHEEYFRFSFFPKTITEWNRLPK